MKKLKINLSNGTINNLGNVYSIMPEENYKEFITRVKTAIKLDFKEDVEIKHPAENKAIIMPMHLTENLNGMDVFPTILITFVKNKDIIRSYMNYTVTGLNYSQEQAFNLIVEKYMSFYNSCENFAKQFSDNLYHY